MRDKDRRGLQILRHIPQQAVLLSRLRSHRMHREELQVHRGVYDHQVRDRPGPIAASCWHTGHLCQAGTEIVLDAGVQPADQ